MLLPKNITVKVYNKITGVSEKEKYIKLIDHYSKNNVIDNMIIALDELNEDVVPLLGERLNQASFVDCVGLEFNKESEVLFLLKPEYSGNVIAHYVLESSCIFSFRYQKATDENERYNNQVSIECIDYEIHVDSEFNIEYLESKGTSLEDADFVILCGFGVGSKENVEEIIKYGNKIGATVCGTKKIIDSGWLPMNLLIGQTGHIISPSLCITIGVSGAAPLLNGILGSKKIIAINNDKNARIFSYADYGIIGDYKKIIEKGLDINENN